MSRIQICNWALTSYLGEGAITDLDEGSPGAIQCSLHFDRVKNNLLERHWWNFAKKRRTMAELTNDRENEWLYRYQVPGDVLAIHWVNDPGAARIAQSMRVSPDIERELIADNIYCDVGGAVIEYTRTIDDESVFPQHFADALAASLASAVALPITQDLKRAQGARQSAMDTLQEAIAMDHRNTPPDEMGLPQHLRDRGVV